jgi:hypothetical protein
MPSQLLHTTEELARRFNAVTSARLRRSDASRWNRDNVRRFLEAIGVDSLPRKNPRGKLRYLESAIRDAVPEFWEALLDAEARARTDRQLERDEFAQAAHE